MTTIKGLTLQDKQKPTKPKKSGRVKCANCGASDRWAATYRVDERQAVELTWKDGEIIPTNYTGGNEILDDSMGEDEEYRCLACDYHIDVRQPDNPDHRHMVEQIRNILSGSEWDADTTSAIADVLTANGYTIEEPDEDEDSEPACRDCGRPCNFEKDGEGFHKDQGGGN